MNYAAQSSRGNLCIKGKKKKEQKSVNGRRDTAGPKITQDRYKTKAKEKTRTVEQFAQHTKYQIYLKNYVVFVFGNLKIY
jgi:hypothetical protein